MKMLKKLCLYAGRLLMACMFAVCMITGVVPIIPKRKEQFEIEVKLEKAGIEAKSNSAHYQENK